MNNEICKAAARLKKQAKISFAQKSPVLLLI